MRSFEEFTTRLAFLWKHARIILISFLTLTTVAFAGLTWAGIKSNSRLQPYSIFSQKKFHDYKLVMEYCPPQLFLKILMGGVDAEIFQYIDAETMKKAWIMVSKDKAKFDVIVSSVLSSISIFLILTFLLKRDIKHRTAKFLRGASLVQPSKLNSTIHDFRITLGKEQVRLPRSFENMGISLFGSPGSGKSTLLKHLIPQIAGNPCLIYDRKPEVYQLFYEQGRDLLLDPKDARTIQWNIFKDISDREDVDNIVSSLIPLSDDPKTAFFEQAGRDIFKAIFFIIRESASPSNKTLIDFLNANGSNRERLYDALKGDPRVEGYLAKDNNTTNSIMTVVSQFSNALVQRHFYHDGDFSVREFIRSGAGQRLFVVNRSATEEAFKAYYTLFFDLAFREFLNRGINRNFRFWFIIDEFPSLMKLETLQMLLAEGRDRGSCPVLGAQDFEQVKKIYGSAAYSIFNQTNTKVIFRVNDPKTTEYLSQAFGEQEFVQQVKTLSAGPKSHRDGYNFGEQQRIAPIILPSEIKGLKALTGYVSIGEYPVTKISLDIFKQPDRTSLIPKVIREIPTSKKLNNGEIPDELLD